MSSSQPFGAAIKGWWCHTNPRAKVGDKKYISTISDVLVNVQQLALQGRKKVCVYTYVICWHKGNVAHILPIIIKYYYKFNVANWFSQKSSVDFCRTLTPAANLWLQLTNKCGSHMNADWYLLSHWWVKGTRNKKLCWNFFYLSMMWMIFCCIR